MKKFLLHFLLFTTLIGILIFSLVFLSDYAVRQRENHLLKLSDEITIVFAGDSYVECAVNDQIIAHSINIAQSGEAYMYSYVKIKSLIEANKKISKVFIGFSFGDLLMEKENSWLFGEEYVVDKIMNYNYLLEASEKSIIFEHEPIAYLRGLMKSIYNNFMTTIESYMQDDAKDHINNFGGYKYLVRDKLQFDPGIDLYNEGLIEKSCLQEKYLKMISELCHEKSIGLILFSTPKHNSYNTNIEKDVKRIWLDTRIVLERDSLLDLSTYHLPDSCYGDLSHLNFKGAELFSYYLNDLINSD